MAKKKPWDIVGDAVGGAGSSASNAGGGGGKGGGAVGSASGGVASVTGGVGAATGTSTGYSSVGAGVASVASGVGTATGTKPSAPTPTYSGPAYSSTTTVNLKPLIGTISDPATRALASSAISNGLKYEVNPSVLLAAASVTDYGRKGQGKGYTNLGDGSEDGPKSIRQAAKYLSEAGFHSDPDGAIKALAKTIGHDPSEIRKTASGYTELDQAARKVEEAPGDTHVKGVGRFKYRKPEDRPSSKVARAARAAAQGVAAGGVAAGRTAGDWGSDDAIAVANGRKPLAANELQAAQGAAALGRTATSAQGILPGAPQQQQPRPRKLGNRLERAVKKAVPAAEVPEVVPPQYRAAVAKYGKMLDKFSGETGMSGAEYLGKLIQFESGWDPNAEGPVVPGQGTAKGLGQFMDGTANTFRSEYGVDPTGSPEEMIKAAAMHASGDYGHPPLYAGYNPGYSDKDPILSVDGGKLIPTGGKGKDIPKQLVQRANKVLGEKATKAILAGGKVVKAPKGGEETGMRPGPWEGSQSIIKELIGPKYASKIDWKDKEDRGDPGGTLHDIGTTNAFAADISIDEGGLDTEKLVDRIAKKIGLDPSEVNYGTTGLESGINYKGYDIEFLPYDHGSGPHVHIAAQWNGGGEPTAPPTIPIKGTNLAVEMPAPSTGGATGTSSSGGVATELEGALNAAGAGSGSGSRATRAAAAPGMTIQSAAAAYARKSLQGGDTSDPLYDAFRPSR